MPSLGVNIDHVATLRQARGTFYPDPVHAALMAEKAGADQITCHLREDRRHIQDQDVFLLRKKIKTRLNLEMAATPEMFEIALEVKPHQVTLVPERREEQTTEGGLNLTVLDSNFEKQVQLLQKNKILVSLFINPTLEDVKRSHQLKVEAVELHTGQYAEASSSFQNVHFQNIRDSAEEGEKLGLKVFAGHGLHYENVIRLLQIPQIEEYNIGHSIISEAVFLGIEVAVQRMKKLLNP